MESLSDRVASALLKQIKQQALIPLEDNLLISMDEPDLPNGKNLTVQAHLSQSLQSENGLAESIRSETNNLVSSQKSKDLYELAARHLKEGHITKIEERPFSELHYVQTRRCSYRRGCSCFDTSY